MSRLHTAALRFQLQMHWPKRGKEEEERDRAALAESSQNAEVKRPEFTPLAAV